MSADEQPAPWPTDDELLGEAQADAWLFANGALIDADGRTFVRRLTRAGYPLTVAMRAAIRWEQER